jgi:hypothetical protein
MEMMTVCTDLFLKSAKSTDCKYFEQEQKWLSMWGDENVNVNELDSGNISQYISKYHLL